MPRRDARVLLAGLALFAVGFAAAGVLVIARLGGTPGYAVAVSLGFLGIGAVGLFSGRRPVETAPPPLWSPGGLTRIADGAGVPAPVVLIVIYALVAVSVLGNLVVPLVTRRP